CCWPRGNWVVNFPMPSGLSNRARGPGSNQADGARTDMRLRSEGARMNTTSTFVAILAVCLLGLADAAWSQAERASPPATPARPSDAMLMRSSTLFGYQVKSPQGE